MNKTFISLLIYFLFLSEIIACSCGGPRSFCISAQYGLAVLEVEVEKKYESNVYSYVRYIDFKVRKTLASKDTIAYSHLTLMEGYSICDQIVYDDLKKGDKLIISYFHIREDSIANYPVTSFSICSVDFLTLKNNTVTGWIQAEGNFEEQSMPYGEFKKNLSQLCDLEILDESSVLVINQAGDKKIDLKNNYQTNLNFEIFSSAGQLVYQGKIDKEEERSIDFIDFPSQIYFIRFRSHVSHITIKTAIF